VAVTDQHDVHHVVQVGYGLDLVSPPVAVEKASTESPGARLAAVPLDVPIPET
jgi:hypothetical protein